MAETPLMEQYDSIKAQHRNEVLFFRLGDFYEMFNEDAVEVSRLLNLTLTHRGDRPMCGIPHHASKIYIGRLLRLGKKIAICEQITLPTGKGLAERKVIEVITPGNALDDEYLDQTKNNYLAALNYIKGGVITLAYADVSTGAFYALSWPESQTADRLAEILGRTNPREIIISQKLEGNPVISAVLSQFSGIAITWEQDWHFSPEICYKRLLDQFQTVNLSSFSLTAQSPEVTVAGYLIDYLARTANADNQNAVLPQFTDLQLVKESEFVTIDDSSRRNLEIVANLQDGSTKYSLLETVSFTETAMGSRLLRFRLTNPLTDIKTILHRQEQVSVFVNHRNELTQIKAVLGKILDVQRLASKIAMERAHAKEVQALGTSLNAWLSVRRVTEQLGFDTYCGTDIAEDMVSAISRALLDDPSTVIAEGGMIRSGWSQELDRLRDLQQNFSSVLEDYVAEEREKTGIPNLRAKFTRNFGYYLEVSKGKLSMVPEHFIMRRSMTNGDRYTTERLRKLESDLLGASEQIVELEKQLFIELRRSIAEKTSYLLQVAEEIAVIDVSCSLAHVALTQNWVCPQIDDSGVMEITQGRHPVVEFNSAAGAFVPNDTNLTDRRFALITGPNMAGKSTYLRQNALITLLAQTGSFVPAQKAHIGIVDKIFCRVGASDNLARGESTFLVEMTESARILRSATRNSLVIMDEIGRGTSTEDGLSIAWAVAEYLLNTLTCKTLFATHYHELTRLVHPQIMMLCLEVIEQDGHIVFVKRIKEGSTQNSYGIHVARLAGIPGSVIARAEEILAGLQENKGFASLPEAVVAPPPQPGQNQAQQKNSLSFNGLFSDEELVIDEILSTDVNSITPMDALQMLARWKKNLSGR